MPGLPNNKSRWVKQLGLPTLHLVLPRFGYMHQSILTMAVVLLLILLGYWLWPGGSSLSKDPPSPLTSSPHQRLGASSLALNNAPAPPRAPDLERAERAEQVTLNSPPVAPADIQWVAADTITPYILAAENTSGRRDETIVIQGERLTPPLEIQPGDSVLLQWDVANAEQVFLNGEEVAASGKKLVTPQDTATYTVRARHGDQEEEKSVTVQVTPHSEDELQAFASAPDSAALAVLSKPVARPHIRSFRVRPPEIRQGTAAVLEWAVDNASAVTITPQVGNVSSRGSFTVRPRRSTVFRLAARNAAGQVAERQLDVLVHLPPAIISHGTVTLPNRQAFDLDTGQVNVKGADILWKTPISTAGYLVPQGKVKLATIRSRTAFAHLSYDTLHEILLGAFAHDIPIFFGNPPNTVRAPHGSLYGAITSEGRYSKIRVDNYGKTVTLSWATYARPQ